MKKTLFGLMTLACLLSNFAFADPAPVPVLVVDADAMPVANGVPGYNAISVHFSDIMSGIYDAIGVASHEAGWNCLSTAFYKVEIVDSSLKPLSTLSVARVHPEGYKDMDKNPWTSCEPVTDRPYAWEGPGTVILILGSPVGPTDKIQVSMYYDEAQTKLLAQSNGQLSFTFGN